MANIEVELRGLLDKKQFRTLSKLFMEKGRFVSAKHRVFVSYPDPETGSLVEECKTDIRVRTTNGIPEISIKQGEWGSADESRREFSLVGKKGEFDKMVMMLAAMGHKKGVMAERKGAIYVYKGIEFSLVEVPGHSYYFEAEVMVKDKAAQQAATGKINKVCAELGLKTLSQQDFFAYINRLNTESNEIFDFKTYEEGYFNKRFGI